MDIIPNATFLDYLDWLSQIIITVTSIKALFAVSSHKATVRKNAAVWALWGQPFWIITALINGQYLVMPLYTIYCVGWYKVYIKNKKLVDNGR